MNVLTKIRAVNELNERELDLGTANTANSWHWQYRNSAWIYAGNMPYNLSEGDLITVFSQYGEIVSINLIRDRETGKSKGFCFICFEDQRSTVLAVDNLNGSKVCGRQMRVDHVEEYKVPKEDEKNEHNDELTNKIHEHGVAPQVMHMYEEKVEIKSEEEDPFLIPMPNIKIKKKPKKEKKTKKSKKSKKKRKSSSSSSSESDTSSSEEEKSKKKKKSKKRRKSSSSSDSDSSSEEEDRRKKKKRKRRSSSQEERKPKKSRREEKSSKRDRDDEKSSRRNGHKSSERGGKEERSSKRDESSHKSSGGSRERRRDVFSRRR